MPPLELPPPPWIVGHRGVRGPAPENTVASLREAVAQGADMVELDLQLTAGGELVAFHDRQAPLAGGGERPVYLLTAGERRRCRPVWRAAGAERTYEIPTLEELLAAAPETLPLNLELKRYDAGAPPGPLVEALCRGLGDRPGVLVSSFDWPLLEALRERRPELALAPLGGRAVDWDELLATARRLGAFSLHLHHQRLTELGAGGRLAEAAAGERPLLAYTVNRPELGRALLELGVSGLFTDRPAALRAALRAAG